MLKRLVIAGLLLASLPLRAEVPKWQVTARVETQPLAAGECSWVSIDVRLPSGKLIPLPDGSGSVGAPQFELTLLGAAATQFKWARNTPGSYNLCAVTTENVEGQILVRYPRADADPKQVRPNVAFEGLLRMRAGGDGDGVIAPWQTLLLVPPGASRDPAATLAAGTGQAATSTPLATAAEGGAKPPIVGRADAGAPAGPPSIFTPPAGQGPTNIGTGIGQKRDSIGGNAGGTLSGAASAAPGITSITAAIRPGDTGPNVGNLQDALLTLLRRDAVRTVAAPGRPTEVELDALAQSLTNERASNMYGPATQKLVQFVQVQQGLGDGLAGVVEERTAGVLNQLLAQPGTSASTTTPPLIVRGRVTRPDGSPAERYRVMVGYCLASACSFARGGGGYRGNAITGVDGRYEISYSALEAINRQLPDSELTLAVAAFADLEDPATARYTERPFNTLAVNVIDVTLQDAAPASEPIPTFITQGRLSLSSGLPADEGYSVKVGFCPISACSFTGGIRGTGNGTIFGTANSDIFGRYRITYSVDPGALRLMALTPEPSWFIAVFAPDGSGIPLAYVAKPFNTLPVNVIDITLP